MGRRSNETFEKRQREKQKAERKAAKQQRREEAKGADEGPGERDEVALMERFRVLSERRAAGQVTQAAYEAERREIFEALGLDA